MIEIGIIATVVIGGALGWVIVQSFFGHRYWRRAIAEGDEGAMRAALIEALDTWRRMRPPADTIPSDWRALQSAEIVAADSTRCRVSLLADPDIRVVDGVRDEVGGAIHVARRSAVLMAERLLYEIPLVRFDAVQVDIHTEYRGPEGATESVALLTTQLTREEATDTYWDELGFEEILATWQTRERQPDAPLDLEDGALIAAEAAGAQSAGAQSADAPASTEGAS